MSLPPKILWAEGLGLEAQHFQQSDRYHEARLQHRTSAIHPHTWGVQSVKWSATHIAAGYLYADDLNVMFQEGEVCRAPHTDALPQAVNLSQLPANERSVIFYAALPVLKEHGGNLAQVNAPRDDLRYTPRTVATPDLYTEGVDINVAYMHKSVRLISQLELSTAYDSIPVVCVRRTAEGGFDIDPAFMPPGLSVDASPALQELLRQLLGKLTTKIDALYQLQRQSNGFAVEAHSSDISSFWMLSTISTACASLAHIAKAGNAHPAELFDKLLGLAGGLMAFSTKFAMADLPVYVHDNPAPGFRELDVMIRALLDTVVSSKYVRIALAIDEARNTYHHGKLDAALVDSKAALYLAVHAKLPALELVAAVPRNFKVASPYDIDTLVRSALPGIVLVHLQQAPAEVPVRPNTHYFSIDHTGERYAAMMKAQAIAIYVPATIPELRLELFAITS